MNKKIYVSEFKSNSESTDRQKALFEADLKYAISKEFEYIQDSEGDTYVIINESVLGLLPGDTPEEVDALIEDYEKFKANYSEEEPNESAAPLEDTESSSDLLTNVLLSGCIENRIGTRIYTIKNLQDKLTQIIGNTLELAEAIQPQRADTLLKLANLKLKLQKCKA